MDPTPPPDYVDSRLLWTLFLAVLGGLAKYLQEVLSTDATVSIRRILIGIPVNLFIGFMVYQMALYVANPNAAGWVAGGLAMTGFQSLQLVFNKFVRKFSA